MTEWPITRLDTIPEGEAHAVEVDGWEIVLCRVDVEVFALSGICTHEDCSLAGGEVEGGVLSCPWHGARFNIRSGRVLGLPALRPLQTFAVRVDGGRPGPPGPALMDLGPTSEDSVLRATVLARGGRTVRRMPTVSLALLLILDGPPPERWLTAP